LRAARGACDRRTNLETGSPASLPSGGTPGSMPQGPGCLRAPLPTLRTPRVHGLPRAGDMDRGSVGDSRLSPYPTTRWQLCGDTVPAVGVRGPCGQYFPTRKLWRGIPLERACKHRGKSVVVPPRAELPGPGIVLIGIIAFALVTGVRPRGEWLGSCVPPPTPNTDPARKGLLAT
jgi:hypothetical protein